MKKIAFILSLLNTSIIYNTSQKITNKTLTKKMIRAVKARKAFRVASAEKLRENFKNHSIEMHRFDRYIEIAEKFGGKECTIERIQSYINFYADYFRSFESIGKNPNIDFLKNIGSDAWLIIFKTTFIL